MDKWGEKFPSIIVRTTHTFDPAVIKNVLMVDNLLFKTKA